MFRMAAIAKQQQLRWTICGSNGFHRQDRTRCLIRQNLASSEGRRKESDRSWPSRHPRSGSDSRARNQGSWTSSNRESGSLVVIFRKPSCRACVQKLPAVHRMNYLSKTYLTGRKTIEDRRCSRCDAQPKLVSRMLDPKTGHTVRMFRCQCGEQTWASDPE